MWSLYSRLTIKISFFLILCCETPAFSTLNFQPPPATRWPTDFPAAAVVSVSRRAPSRRCRSHIWCYNCCVPHRTATSSKFQWHLAPRWWDKNPRSCRWCRLDADFDDWPRAVSCWKPHQWSHMEANPPNFVPLEAAIWVQLAKTCRGNGRWWPSQVDQLFYTKPLTHQSCPSFAAFDNPWLINDHR